MYWKKRLKLTVTYKLRISSLYHEKAESSGIVKQKLVTWSKEIKEKGINFSLEAISVCKELSDHKPRQLKCDGCKKNTLTTQTLPGGATNDTSCPGCTKLNLSIKEDRKRDDDQIERYVEDIKSAPLSDLPKLLKNMQV